ncbi:hypothetical protein TNCV_1298671 [Trichonephila clavipes]|nr:hypothetical protein TNCV_1298671 [Trichonephila clavipes]
MNYYININYYKLKEKQHILRTCTCIILYTRYKRKSHPLQLDTLLLEPECTGKTTLHQLLSLIFFIIVSTMNRANAGCLQDVALHFTSVPSLRSKFAEARPIALVSSLARFLRLP